MKDWLCLKIHSKKFPWNLIHILNCELCLKSYTGAKYNCQKQWCASQVPWISCKSIIISMFQGRLIVCQLESQLGPIWKPQLIANHTPEHNLSPNLACNSTLTWWTFESSFTNNNLISWKPHIFSSILLIYVWCASSGYPQVAKGIPKIAKCGSLGESRQI